MAYVITDSCIRDLLCRCMSDRLHSPQEKRARLRGRDPAIRRPAGCIDCGACVPVHTSDSIYAVDDLPAELKQFVDTNAAYFAG
jgi:NAD-dependent dihydropyrimidine dehydrogenase PreA subunit